jgi:hypothetical protein
MSRLLSNLNTVPTQFGKKHNLTNEQLAEIAYLKHPRNKWGYRGAKRFSNNTWAVEHVIDHQLFFSEICGTLEEAMYSYHLEQKKSKQPLFNSVFPKIIPEGVDEEIMRSRFNPTSKHGFRYVIFVPKMNKYRGKWIENKEYVYTKYKDTAIEAAWLVYKERGDVPDGLAAKRDYTSRVTDHIEEARQLPPIDMTLIEPFREPRVKTGWRYVQLANVECKKHYFGRKGKGEDIVYTLFYETPEEAIWALYLKIKDLKTYPLVRCGDKLGDSKALKHMVSKYATEFNKLHEEMMEELSNE